MPKLILVVPCYNEARRLPVAAFNELVETPGRGVVFVDDGSTDATPEVLEALRLRRPEKIFYLRLPFNQGKGPAVRAGMLQALSMDPDYVGYWDADLAAPLSHLPSFLGLLESEPRLRLAMGARVKLLGRDIRRSAFRHYTGRVFGTLASLAVGMPVYDTQCGAKIFRVTGELPALFARPFGSKWAFDVELLARLGGQARKLGQRPEDCIVEIPLFRWVGSGDSRVTLRAGGAAFGYVLKMALARALSG